MFPLGGALWAVRFTGGGHSQGEAVDLFEVFGGEADEAVEEAVFGALPCDGFLSHFGKAGVVDADLCEGGREAELFLEVFPQAFDAFIFFICLRARPVSGRRICSFVNICSMPVMICSSILSMSVSPAAVMMPSTCWAS